MSLRSSRTAVAGAAALLTLPLLAGAAAATTSSFVLSVGHARLADVARGLPAGASVVSEMPRIGALHVVAPTGSLSRLAAVPGVRGVSRDVTLRAMSAGSGSSGGVLAPEAVGGIAGAASTGRGVVVAVLDSGVEPTAALGRSDKRLITGPDFSDATGARDAFGHGTFMANLIAGGKVAGDTIGIAPAASVLDVKVAGADGSTSLSKVVNGLNWVAEHGHDYAANVVVSLSLGAARPTDSYGSDPLTDAADQVQAAGIPVVVASGNDPSQVTDPGQDPGLFTIGAADTAAGAVASFSGRGAPAGMRKPDVVTAGVHVLSLLPPDSAIAQANPGSRSGKLYRGSGTSQATAVAAGAVAAFLSGKSGVSPQDVRASFGTAARDLAGEGDGYGLLVIPTAVVDGDPGPSSAPGSGSSGSPDPQASSWSASSWSASSWSASSWSASSWSASSWSASSWSASSWSASSWSASSWS